MKFKPINIYEIDTKTNCPFCGSLFPQESKICSNMDCGAYRVKETDEGNWVKI